MLAVFVLLILAKAAIAQQADFRIVSIGGITDNNRTFTNDVDIYSISTNTHFNNATAAPANVSWFGSAIQANNNNNIYIVGGYNGSNDHSNNFWSYNVNTNTWTTNLRPAPHETIGSAVVALSANDGKNSNIFLLGGHSGNGEPVRDVFSYDTGSRIWFNESTPLPDGEGWFPCAVVVNKTSIFYIMDGDLYRSDDETRTWKQLSSMTVPRFEAACVALQNDQAILVGGGWIGGNEGTALASVEKYDIATDIWSTVTSMQKQRRGLAAVAIPDSSNVLFCGGMNTDQIEVYDSCEAYDWNNNRWGVPEFQLNMPRAHFGLFVAN